MRVIPVIDLKGGVVVRGVAGRREEYRPIVSRLTSSYDPVEVARAFRDRLGLDEVYLADLDAIGGAEPAWAVYDAIRRLGCRLWVDAGIRDAARAEALAGAGVERIVAGLETLAGPAVLERLCREYGERVVLSLDLQEGRPLGNQATWGAGNAGTVIALAVAAGVRSVIVLDLARVGVGGGTGTEQLCRHLADQFPGLEVVAGGGVRDQADLLRLQACGVQAVLVASALHDLRIGPADWQGLQSSDEFSASANSSLSGSVNPGRTAPPRR